MPAQQGKTPKGGRKLKRCGKAALKSHFLKNFGRVEMNRRKRVARHEAMVLDSQERNGGTTASRRSFEHRKARAESYGK